jgi:hypothetical protein
MHQVSVSLLLGMVVFLGSGLVRIPLSVTGLHFPVFSFVRSLLKPSPGPTPDPTPAPNFCVNCVFFMGNDLENPALGKCRMNPIPMIPESRYYLVTGVPDKNHTEYRFCTTARSVEHMCGKEGKQYMDFK